MEAGLGFGRGSHGGLGGAFVSSQSSMYNVEIALHCILFFSIFLKCDVCLLEFPLAQSARIEYKGRLLSPAGTAMTAVIQFL